MLLVMIGTVLAAPLCDGVAFAVEAQPDEVREVSCRTCDHRARSPIRVTRAHTRTRAHFQGTLLVPAFHQE